MWLSRSILNPERKFSPPRLTNPQCGADALFVWDCFRAYYVEYYVFTNSSTARDVPVTIRFSLVRIFLHERNIINKEDLQKHYVFVSLERPLLDISRCRSEIIWCVVV